MTTAGLAESMANELAENLARADRHCDLEGLPTASGFARGLDGHLVSGRISGADAVQMLVAFHRELAKVPKARR